MPATAAGANPHPSIDKRITLVTTFHRQVEAVLIRGRIDGVCVVGVLKLLENILGTSQPALSLDHDVCWWFIGTLQDVIGA